MIFFSLVIVKMYGKKNQYNEPQYNEDEPPL